jgi:hypothetical protein
MSVYDELLQLHIQLDAGADADAMEIDELTTQLRRQLLGLDVESVDRIPAGDAPPGTRAVEVMALGGLLITLTKSPELLKMVASVIQSWVASRSGRSVEVQIAGDTLKVSGVSSEEQQRLINFFVAQQHVR